MTPRDGRLLSQLASAAGLQAAWRDATGVDRRVEDDTLCSVLEALGIPCGSEAQCRDSLRGLQEEAERPPALLIVRPGQPLNLRCAGSPHYRLLLEDGSCIMGTARSVGGGHVSIPGVRRPGYHRLEIGRTSISVAVAPQRCPPVAELAGTERAWVLGAQVYGLRRGAGAKDGARAVVPAWEAGGDFTAVGTLACLAAEQGAVGLAISPVHAMFSADASRYSPYSPSSRLFLNALYADPAVVFDEDMLRPLRQQAPALLDAQGCLDWRVIQPQRLVQLRRLYDLFRSAQPAALVQDFAGFRRMGGETLAGHARYEALHAHHAPELGAGHGWRDWPAQYQDPDSEAVRRHAQENADEVEFHAFLQWLAARGMADAHARAGAAGMPFGLIADMAVGTDPRGSHAWCRQEQIMTGVSVGAPPDIFQTRGQNWGLTAFSPRALHLNGYRGFIETLRAALAHAGGLRVDHVLGLQRMWLVPSGAGPSAGVYLGYPREALMALLALEAWRHQAVVVGENLGTVPEDFDAALAQYGIVGMSVLWFEQEGGERPVFRERGQWPARSMAMVSTHDLPTLRGWWMGRDLDWRERLEQFDAEEAAQQREARDEQKRALWSALQEAGLAEPDASVPDAAPAAEVLTYVAGTPAALVNVSLEDLLGEEEQPNLPGGCPPDAALRHPDWCRTMKVNVDELLRQEGVDRLLEAVRQGRAGAGGRREERGERP